jgi:hypothetical protein
MSFMAFFKRCHWFRVMTLDESRTDVPVRNRKVKIASLARQSPLFSERRLLFTFHQLSITFAREMFSRE